jgi:hypothetical protein
VAINARHGAETARNRATLRQLLFQVNASVRRCLERVDDFGETLDGAEKRPDGSSSMTGSPRLGFFRPYDCHCAIVPPRYYTDEHHAKPPNRVGGSPMGMLPGIRRCFQSRIAVRTKPWTRCIGAAGMVVLWVASTGAVCAGDFDGSQPLSGTTGKIIEINRYKIIDDVDPDTVGLPQKFLIDFEAKLLRPSQDSLVRKTIQFKSVEHIENKMVIQGIDTGVEGVEDALAWSLAISKKDGKAVLSASGDGVAYVVFGMCTPVRDSQSTATRLRI